MSLTDQIFAAGIVGCGGAGFPTHAKLNGDAEWIILNAAECEPLLRTDRYILRHLAGRVIAAASAVRRELGDIRCTVATKSAYRQELTALREAIAQIDPEISIHEMESFYPAGDEQTLVAEVTGQAVPPAGIPLDVGCVVSNVATMLSIADAMEGKPFIWKYLTVSGLVREPSVIHVPVGTSYADCIALAGGVSDENHIVVCGGPMMGKRMTRTQAADACITKTTSGILLLPDIGPIAAAEKISVEHMKNRARSACIQCSQCTDLCPRHLLGHPIEPHRIMRKLAFAGAFSEILDDPAVQNAALCCECGVCELFACPMSLQPRRVNALIKAELAKAEIRYPKGSGARDISPWRSGRKLPSKRAAARAGVLGFYDVCGTDTLRECIPAQVKIALRQNIGAPAEPVIRDGESVTAGQLIAKCPEGKLGANLHASISGTARIDPGYVTIQEGEGAAV
ncbi:hypothetical protein DWV16_09600 [Anaerotruncus sp. AF02-27]|uniref:4Fe-4S dicluster domain-containing protein n=1 Tax=Anaerotruncus TaxID=244127 RepID=UPI000E4F8919|nr:MULTISPECIES: 4Fe-4S dicluster domain-containing protein [Anaerotruncus]RGX55225.1 hypothetical protein DWV16_09600 [Anaerotruncus sp. AF02-27]